MCYFVQYQARGTPHVHSLICISNSDGIKQSSVGSDDISEQNKVKNCMKNIVSANLVGRVDDKSKEENTNDAHDIETQYDGTLTETILKTRLTWKLTHDSIARGISTGMTMESFWMKMCNVTSEICREQLNFIGVVLPASNIASSIKKYADSAFLGALKHASLSL